MKNAITSTRLPLAGKTALVTGGIRGIGRGISMELAKRGANIAMVYADPSRSETATQAVNEIMLLGSGAKAVSILADLAIADIYEKIVHQTLQAFNTTVIDIVDKSLYEEYK